MRKAKENPCTPILRSIAFTLHFEARYDWEPDEHKCRPSYFYPHEQRFSSQCEFSEEKYGDLKRNLTTNLIRVMKNAGYEFDS